MVVPASHAVRAQRLCTLRHGSVARGGHAGIAPGAQVLRRVKAERCGVAQSTGVHPAPACPEGLRRVLDQRQAVLRCQRLQGVPVRALTVQVHRQQGFHTLAVVVAETLGRTLGGQVHADRLDIREHRRCARAKNAARRGEK